MSNGITFHFQDLEYKTALMQEDFIRELRCENSKSRRISSPSILKTCACKFQRTAVTIELTLLERIIERLATEPNESSYILTEMIPTYRKVGSDSGKQYAVRRGLRY
ncbi:hypothetical protein ACMFMF_003263 [Clarireedia jacksonii]